MCFQTTQKLYPASYLFVFSLTHLTIQVVLFFIFICRLSRYKKIIFKSETRKFLNVEIKINSTIFSNPTNLIVWLSVVFVFIHQISTDICQMSVYSIGACKYPPATFIVRTRINDWNNERRMTEHQQWMIVVWWRETVTRWFQRESIGKWSILSGCNQVSISLAWLSAYPVTMFFSVLFVCFVRICSFMKIHSSNCW